jgi:hypothetical protein
VAVGGRTFITPLGGVLWWSGVVEVVVVEEEEGRLLQFPIS